MPAACRPTIANEAPEVLSFQCTGAPPARRHPTGRRLGSVFCYWRIPPEKYRRSASSRDIGYCPGASGSGAPLRTAHRARPCGPARMTSGQRAVADASTALTGRPGRVDQLRQADGQVRVNGSRRRRERATGGESCIPLDDTTRAVVAEAGWLMDDVPRPGPGSGAPHRQPGHRRKDPRRHRPANPGECLRRPDCGAVYIAAAQVLAVVASTVTGRIRR